MVCIDSNFFIYAAQPNQGSLRVWLSEQEIAVSVKIKIEVLGYHPITGQEMELAQYYFSICRVLHLNEEIVTLAINLKQKKKMSLGDSIIAATAFQNKIPLATANIKDFNHIPS